MDYSKGFYTLLAGVGPIVQVLLCYYINGIFVQPKIGMGNYSFLKLARSLSESLK